MSARTVLFATLAAFTALFALLFANAISGIGTASYSYLSPNDVRGMAVVHQDRLYTLNFEQQNDLILAFNRATALEPKTAFDALNVQLEAAPVKHVIVYRFNAPDMHIDLSGFFDKDQNHKLLLFKNPAWSTEMLSSPVAKTFPSMLSNTYDH